MGQWSRDLMCNWIAWEASETEATTLLLKLEDGHACDMSGAIRVAQNLMPNVECISVFSGAHLDIVYRHSTDGWTSRRPV